MGIKDANTLISSTAIGNREDLTDIIYRISPTTTPVLNMASKSKASSTKHEWQVQELASAASNVQGEGYDATFKAVTVTARLFNYTQISSKSISVSGTERSVNPAGRKDEYAYQMSLAALELKRDMEYGLCRNDVYVATATGRKSRGLIGWVVDNTNTNGSTTLASYTGNTGYTQSGATRSFTESLLKDILQQCFTAGGEPDFVMVGPAQKQTFSTFTGNATRMDKSEDQKLYAAIDFYVSDFGTLQVIANRFQDSKQAFALQSDKLAIAYLRPFQTFELAKTGDADNGEILAEYTMECRAPKAHGASYDLT